jgi:hypothetical protein
MPAGDDPGGGSIGISKVTMLLPCCMVEGGANPYPKLDFMKERFMIIDC